MSRYVDHRASPSQAPAAKRANADICASLSGRAAELRARAARYKRLAKILSDPRSIELAESCAQELEAEAVILESQQSGTR